MALGTALGAAAETKLAKTAPTMGVGNFDLRKDGDKLLLDMTLDAAKLRMSTNKEMVYTPMIVNGTDTVRMRSFSVAGKTGFYSHVRAHENTSESIAYRAGQIKEPIEYKYEIPFSKWMEDARLEMECQERGCCNKNGNALYVPIAQIDLVPRS